MAENIKQIFDGNASSTLPDTALLYAGLDPFAPGDDTAITVASFKTQLNGYYLLKSNNLDDVDDVATAQTNLDVPTRTGGNASGTWGIDISGSVTTGNGYIQTTTGDGDVVTFRGYRTSSMSYLTFGTITAGATPALAFSRPLDGNFTITGATITSSGLNNTNSIDAAAINSGLLSPIVGGTGVNNGVSTITCGGSVSFASSFTTSGAHAVTQTYTAPTNVTFPPTGTLATTSDLPTPAALTRTDDTNVTLTLGGSPSTALINAASITAGWTGQLGVTRGGTGLASTTINQILYSSANNTIAGLATANNGTLITSAGGVPSISSTLPTAVQNNITLLGTIAENFTCSYSNSGNQNTVTVTNSSNTAGSDAALRATVGGTSGGDPTYTLIINGGSGFSAGLDNSDNDSFKEEFNTTIGTSPTRVVTITGERTMPLQPAFFAYRSSNVANVTGAGTVYTVPFNTEVYDQNSDYNNSTFTFTAPVTGRYHFCISVGMFGLTSLMNDGHVDLVASNRTIRGWEGNPFVLADSSASLGLAFSTYVDMDAADTAIVQVTISNGAGDTADLDGGSAPTRTFFCGSLIC